MSVEMRRRAELVEAAILEIGETGSLDITVGQIASRAGVSPALAFHYFGDKERLFLAAMRQVLKVYGDAVRKGLATAGDPSARLDCVIDASFGRLNFQPGTIAAWLNFYVMAYRSDQARRLLGVYRSRLRSNLTHDLRPLAGDAAPAIARRIAGLIDGLYLHAAHSTDEVSGAGAVADISTALARELAACA